MQLSTPPSMKDLNAQKTGASARLLSRRMILALALFAAVGAPALRSQAAESQSKTKTEGKKMTAGKNPMVKMETSLGDVEIELNQEKAPISVANFLKYVDDGFFNGTIFHRVINNFMIQGGGFTPDMNQKPTQAPIKNEAGNGLKNSVGTLAMARTGIVDSATAQFFINVKDNSFLDHSGESAAQFGYAVFGKVTNGMDVVEKIKAVPTTTKSGMTDVPATPVVIKSIKRM